mmetsp:Transcript_113514/g.244389  ORF Transcript_113514/g.244389 Transcript_113514/m.244389 type:complete len:265 (+) Transcript_113514:612-1406(+)
MHPTKLSRRLLASRRAISSTLVGTFVWDSAWCSAACLSSRSEAQTRSASRGGSSSCSSSRRARTAHASFQRSRGRLSSGSEAMRRCSRTTRSARRSIRAFRCFSSSFSMISWKTSSRRTSDLKSPQHSSPPRSLVQSSYVVSRSSGRPKRSSMRWARALAALRSFSRSSSRELFSAALRSSAKQSFLEGSESPSKPDSPCVASATLLHVQLPLTPFSFSSSRKAFVFSACVCARGRSSTPELSPRIFLSSGGMLQQLTFVSLLK